MGKRGQNPYCLRPLLVHSANLNVCRVRQTESDNYLAHKRCLLHCLQITQAREGRREAQAKLIFSSFTQRSLTELLGCSCQEGTSHQDAWDPVLRESYTGD